MLGQNNFIYDDNDYNVHDDDDDDDDDADDEKDDLTNICSEHFSL